MNTNKSPETDDATDRLIRVRAERRGTPLELTVHYQKSLNRQCAVYQILTMEDIKG